MTKEEDEFMQKWPGIPEAKIPGILAGLKHQEATVEGAKQATERGVVVRPLSLR